jgi:hypothetical protein
VEQWSTEVKTVQIEALSRPWRTLDELADLEARSSVNRR